MKKIRKLMNIMKQVSLQKLKLENKKFHLS